MQHKRSIVVTTVNYPTKAVKALAIGSRKYNIDLILIGDEKTPLDFQQDEARYYNLNMQQDLGFKYAKIAPTRHYARKNIGYLIAAKDGAEVILETDDDNIPLETFWHCREVIQRVKSLDSIQWVNIYKYFSRENVWPRGLPLDRIHESPPELANLQSSSLYCPIQQGLANGDPDVDAIYRLTINERITFDSGISVAINGQTWCPFNSQNTTWWREAFELLYLPYYCSFRMTDIWRSFVALRIMQENGWSTLFHSPTVFQDRNEHDLIKDFNEEIPGYIANSKIRSALEKISLRSGRDNIGKNMISCYETLIKNGWIGAPETPLLEAWLDDICSN